MRLARLKETHFSRSVGSLTPDGGYPSVDGPSITIPVLGVSYMLPLAGIIDVPAEVSRLTKELSSVEKDRDSLAGRLANPNFTERAKPEAVEKARSDHEAKAAEAERLRAALERLG